jgi:hypothetical protein
MMSKLNLSKDLQKYCLSFLSEHEKNYSENKWRNFPKNDICRIAAEKGWLDLLKWVVLSGLLAQDKIVVIGTVGLVQMLPVMDI